MDFSIARLVYVALVAFGLCLLWRIVAKRHLWAMRVAETLIAIFLGFVLFALQLQAVPADTPFRLDRIHCRHNLMQIGFALHSYHNEYGSFPPAYIADEQGRRIHSWRTLILPYLDREPLTPIHLEIYNRYRFAKPWDSPNNLALAQVTPWIYNCRSNFHRRTPTLNYLAVVGPGAAWPGTRPARLSEDFPDGADKTILVVEVVDAGIEWTEPRDLPFGEMIFEINGPAGKSISSRHRVVNVLFADGHVDELPENTSPEAIQAMLTANGHDAADLQRASK